MARRRSKAPDRQATRRSGRLRLLQGEGRDGASGQAGRWPGTDRSGPDLTVIQGADCDGPIDEPIDAGVDDLMLDEVGLGELDMDHLELETMDLDSALDGLVSILLETISTCRRPLDAELAVCEGLGPVDEMAPREASHADREHMRAHLTDEVIARAERTGTADALLLLRVSAVLADPQIAARARAAADRLAGRGVPDRPWAPSLGRPRVLRAWRYGDLFGGQQSVCVMFDYAAREHVAAVLIDNTLGGGVKDIWFTDGRSARTLRGTVAEAMAAEPSCYLEDIDLAEAGAVLRAALAEPPCPEQPDQKEDVSAYLPLLRSRTELLPVRLPTAVPSLADGGTESGTSAPAGDRSAARPPRAVLRLKAGLKGTKPPVWRRLEVAADSPLSVLHLLLQVAFGWDGTGSHDFAGLGPGMLPGDRPAGAEQRIRVNALTHRIGDRMRYRYQPPSGDGWELVITVEALSDPEPGVDYPRCTAGRRAAPPQDCGGLPGYRRLLQRLDQAGSHPAASHPVAFDPATFHPDQVTAAFAQLLAGRQPATSE